jgi:diaminopimelate epimerase
VTITLTKHHGLGNDFLIGIDPERSFTPADAVKWCHRRHGVGADGLIMLTPLKLGWQMMLHNSDGSRAELSGNGLRCVGQALAMAEGLHVQGSDSRTFAVMTEAGPRGVIVYADSAHNEAQVQVAMGRANAGPDTFDGWADFGIDPKQQVGIDMGNPHLVVEVADPASVDLATVGPAVEANYPDGLNIHFISARNRAAIDLKVWERGAGITEACGSGACAAAHAANEWGLVDAIVEVHQPGGVATVLLEDSGVSLRGPAAYIATVAV